MKDANRYAKVASALTESLGLQQSPVAISFTDVAPAGTAAPARVAAGCQFWQEGASHAIATSAVDHNLCAIGLYTHNLESAPAQQQDLHDALKVFDDLGYLRPQDIPLVPVLKSQPKYVVYAPLGEISVDPDVVLLIVNAAQTLILSEAAQQVESGDPPAMGRPACAVVPQVVNSGRAALSLGCCGARAYLDTLTDSTAIFAIPGDKLDVYAERVTTLAKANSVLATFHQRRRRDVEAGQSPTVRESLAAMGT